MATQSDAHHTPLANIIHSTKMLINHDDPLQYVTTFAERSAAKILRSFRCIFIKGKSGSGKSRIGLKLLDDMSKEKGCRPIILTSYNEWNLIPQTQRTYATNNNPKYVVMLDNIFGCSNLGKLGWTSGAGCLTSCGCRIWTHLSHHNIQTKHQCPV
ncbi:uncharacterized protein LOC124258550 [Haliotis rubra]|uniref:uncharacterized protein LOC124258550 n=1 Tax=Haliotis rubra TaxID=36100 RepID=UPI001EE5DC69|nr:uncharacterized protein LOC124258550 [Haliotis rubra]